MNILYLVDRKTYLIKMSRVRFHAIQALEKICNVTYSGLGWNNYDNTLSVQKNIDKMSIKFNIVIVYKPLEFIKFKEVKIPKCIRYNEMWDIEWTLKEIYESGCELVICHHLNDCEKYQKMNIKNVKFVYIGHCAENTIFKDYKLNLKNKYDVLFAGAVSHYHYPLRERYKTIIDKLNNKGYNCLIQEHPGYKHIDSHTNKYLIKYALNINKSKIVLACTSLWKYRLAKYIEIPMCNVAAICGDIPKDNSDNYNYVIKINNNMSDDEIIEIIEYYLHNENERIQKVKNGIQFSKNYTQENYANRLKLEIENFLKSKPASLLNTKLPSGKLLSEKLDFTRRYKELNSYIDKYLFEAKQSNDKNNYIIDLGPGPGDFLKIFRDELNYPNIKGYDARLDSIEGMGKNYVNLCYHYTMENNIPIEYCDFHETGFLGIKDNSVFIINSRGSFEQIFRKYLLGKPHYIDHKSDQTWSHSIEMHNKLKNFFIDCSNILVKNGILLISFNGSKCNSLQNVINLLLPNTLVIQNTTQHILKLIKT